MNKLKNEYLLEFGNHLRKIRVARSISQNQLGFETDLSREFINRIENGKVNISLTNLIAIAKALDIQLKQLTDF